MRRWLAKMASAEIGRLNRIIEAQVLDLAVAEGERDNARLRAQECAADYGRLKDSTGILLANITTDLKEAQARADRLGVQLASRPTAAAPQWFENAYQHPNFFNEVWYSFLLNRPEVQVSVEDNVRGYWLPTAEQFEIMRQHWITLPEADLSRYTPERRDCDDYAVGFYAMCRNEFGINGVSWVARDATGAHSYNAVAFPGDTAPRFFEPEGSVFVTLADTGLYQLKKGLVVI